MLIRLVVLNSFATVNKRFPILELLEQAVVIIVVHSQSSSSRGLSVIAGKSCKSEFS